MASHYTCDVLLKRLAGSLIVKYVNLRMEHLVVFSLIC